MHTPAPWTMKQGRNKSLWVMAPDEACVAEIGGHFEGHHEANARLIAAAPDLAAAILPFFHSLSRAEYEKAISNARAALQKAGISDPINEHWEL
jgi:hypothetical protein